MLCPPDPNALATNTLVTSIDIDAVALAHGAASDGRTEGRGVWEAEFHTRRFPRLTGIAMSDVPDIGVRLEFALSDGKPAVQGVLRGTVEMLCQRCLRNMRYQIDESFDLVLVNNEAELDRLPESQDAWLMNSGRLDVTDLVEEQLLLAMPLIAKHSDESECVAAVSTPTTKQFGRRVEAVRQAPTAAPDRQLPFANLRDLLRK